MRDVDPDSSALTAAGHVSAALVGLAQATRAPDLAAPTVWSLLGRLRALGGELPDSLRQLTRCLEVGLREQRLQACDGGDPAEAVAAARSHLERAARLFRQADGELASAQHALRDQAAAATVEPAPRLLSPVRHRPTRRAP